MSKFTRCDTCAAWETADSTMGQCCLNPPNVTGFPARDIAGDTQIVPVTLYPVTRKDQGCFSGIEKTPQIIN